MNDRFKFRIRYRCGGCDSINNRYIDWNPLESMINHECEHCMGAAWIEEVLSEEQCTGLRDKNGQLIFEGDIVDCFNEHYEQLKAVCVFSDGSFCFELGNYQYCFGCDCQIQHAEVIGNIHENPELLEKTN